MEKTIFKANLAAVTEKLDKLARKASKLGLAPITYSLKDAPPVIRHIEPAFGQIFYCGPCFDPDHKRSYPQVTITWEGEAPVIGGWQLMATIEHMQGSDVNLIHGVPGITQDLSAYHERRICDHCGTSRYRLETYVISDGQELKQVGRNCLADFIRSPEYAANLISAAEYYREIMFELDPDKEDEGPRGHYVPEHNTLRILTLAVACIATYGYVKKSDDHAGPPTVFRIQDHFNSTNQDAKIETTPEDEAKAKLCLDWIKDQAENSDYIRNLKILAGAESIADKHMGYLVSLPLAYDRAMAQPVSKNSDYVGSIGAKLELTGQITKLMISEGYYGFRQLVQIEDEAGNLITWWASKPQDDLQTGAKVRIKGTVKDHSVYRELKQTILTRAKIEGI